LHGGEHVLGAVIELVNEQPTRLLRRLALKKISELPGQEIEKM